jgi:hypothetical protein
MFSCPAPQHAVPGFVMSIGRNTTVIGILIRAAARTVRLLHHAFTAAVRAVAARLRAAWNAHRRLLSTNPAYGAALAAGAATVVRQTDPVDVFAAIAAALLAGYTAYRAGGFRRPDPAGDLGDLDLPW